MLNDLTRNRAFQEAIQKVVNEESIVLDLGAGTGLLSLYASKAGAKRVWAIERNPETAKIAEQIIETNDDRKVIQIIRARSQDVRYDPSCQNPVSDWCIPEKVNVLISETLATDVNGEYWLGSLLDMKRRGLLAPDVVIIPSSVEVFGQGVWSGYGMPEGNQLSGFDYSAMAPKRSYEVTEIEMSSISHRNITGIVSLVEFDYQSASPYNSPSVPGVWPQVLVTSPAVEGGWLNGMVMWWRAKLAEGVYYETKQGILSAWQQKLFVMTKSYKVEKGESIDIGLAHNGHYSYGVVQPTSVRDEETYLIIDNWYPGELVLRWYHNNAFQTNSTIPPLVDDATPVHLVILGKPGHLFNLEQFDIKVPLAPLLNFWFVDRDGSVLYIPNGWTEVEES